VSPFALRRELLPTSPNFLDDTRITTNTPCRLTTRPLLAHAGCFICRRLRNYVPRSTLQLQHVFCTTLLQDHLCPRHTRSLLSPPRQHQAIGTSADRLQALKTRRKKNVKKGIQFCLMVCGASGTGRTTFVNTLCGKKVLEHKESDDPTVAHVEEGVKIQPITVGTSPQQTLENVADQLTMHQSSTRRAPVSHSPSSTHPDLVTRSTTRRGRSPLAMRWNSRSRCISFQEIVGYLERQYDGILAEESRIKRNPRFRDDRVHVLLYFITPTGHGSVTPFHSTSSD
jgi:hypothetical protein